MEKDLTFTFTAGGVDQNLPLIYRWRIMDANGELKGLYIGKAKAGGERPLKHYKSNVKRLLAGKPYRKSNPEGFRKSHRALAEAVRNGYTVNLSFVCNVAEGESIDFVEQSLIKQHDCCGEAFWQLNQ
jgi:hypothetical protein